MSDATQTAIEKLSGWAEVVSNEALKDEMYVARVFYGGAPAVIRCVGGEIAMSVINPRDYWAVAPDEGVGG